MIGIYRFNATRCRLVLGHQQFELDESSINMAFDIAQALHRAVTDGRGTVYMMPQHKLAMEWDGHRLWLHVHSGTAPSHWYTTFPREELGAWCAQFLAIANCDAWDAESKPKAPGHLIPMRLASFAQPKGPYARAWALLRYCGMTDKGAQPESYEEIAALCSRNGLSVKRRLAIVPKPSATV